MVHAHAVNTRLSAGCYIPGPIIYQAIIIIARPFEVKIFEQNVSIRLVLVWQVDPSSLLVYMLKAKG